MENASKALIIAGAILISILLISVGVLIMNSADEVVGKGTSQMDAQAIQIFNSQFLNYAGIQRGSTVKQLLQTVISSNEAHKDVEEEQVEVSFGKEKESDPATIIGDLKPSTKYKVEISTQNGLVSTITITNE